MLHVSIYRSQLQRFIFLFYNNAVIKRISISKIGKTNIRKITYHFFYLIYLHFSEQFSLVLVKLIRLASFIDDHIYLLPHSYLAYMNIIELMDRWHFILAILLSSVVLPYFII